MTLTRDTRHHEFTIRLPWQDLVRLHLLCDSAVGHGLDSGGFARRVLGAIRRLYESETVRQPQDQPLCVFGPGGDYQRHWPAHTAELIGGPPAAAVAEACDRR